MKEREMSLVRELYPELALRAEAASQRRGRQRSNLPEDELRGRLQLATAANALDFFKDPGSIRDDIMETFSFVIDDSKQLEAKLRDASRILYLADNAGELYFDLPLVKWMQQFAHVTYVVKPSPVQNDLSLKDGKGSVR